MPQLFDRGAEADHAIFHQNVFLPSIGEYNKNKLKGSVQSHTNIGRAKWSGLKQDGRNSLDSSP